jgi:hypothetical protein
MTLETHTPQAADLLWIKSSYSSNEGGECVEVASVDGAVLVRDSKDVARPHIAVGRIGWQQFTESLGLG